MDFASVQVQDWLHADPRPTCVFLVQAETEAEGVSLNFINHALQSRSHLLRDISEPEEGDHGGACSRIRTWVRDTSATASPTIALDLDHAEDGSVYGYTFDGKWKIVQWRAASTLYKNCDDPVIENGHAKDNVPSAETLRLQPPPMGYHSNHSGEIREALVDRDNAATKLASMHVTIEMIDVGFFEYDTNGKLLFANEAFYRLSGHPRGDAEGYSWLDCVFEEDKDSLMDHWVALSEGKSRSFEMRWKRPMAAMADGHEDLQGQWVLAACLPNMNAAGEVVRLCGCITDISAQKRSESDALKRAEVLERAQISERRFTRFADVANVGIYIVDLDMKMQYCNNEWYAITGHPVVNFSEVEWVGFVVDEDLSVIADYWNKMITTKKAVNFQFRFKKPWSNGKGAQATNTWVMCCVYPEANDDGSITTVGGFLTDISHLKWAESAQKQRTDEAIEAKRQQENFIDMTCHEIRNPLGAVMHCADLIESSTSDMAELLRGTIATLSDDMRARYEDLLTSSTEAVNTIVSCSTHQKRIMDDILTLSKLDSKLLTIVPSLSQVDDVLRNVEKMFEVDARKVDVTLRVLRERSVDSSDIDWVKLDGGRLVQVLINLLTNALKFTQTEAEKVVTVSMRVSRSKLSEQELGVEFVPLSTVRDRSHGGSTPHSGPQVFLYFKVDETGCGFGKEQKLAIFQRFMQASPRTHSKYGGSGLGLFITRELVEMQGGEIGVSSQPGKGSTFAFYITAAIAAGPAADDKIAESHALNKISSPKTPNATYTILVVEDNLVNQKVMEKQLVKMGHTVYVASHGREALSFLKTTNFWRDMPASAISLNVVCMDVEMPVLDGISCTREIRAAQSRGEITRHLPIIAVSANARHEQVNFAIECGMDDAISKPFRITELIPKIERLSQLHASEVS